MTIAIYIEFTPRPGQRDVLIERLRHEARECIARDDGCLRMELALPQTADDARVWLIELWRDRAAIDAHGARPGHSHAWQQPLVEHKVVSVCTVLESPQPAARAPGRLAAEGPANGEHA